MVNEMNKTVLITGASTGIGRALAVQYSLRGYAVGLCARRLNLLESLKDELSANGKVAIAELDVTDYDNVPIVLNSLANELGGADIVIANAGISERSNPGESTFASDKKIIEVNVLGAIATIDAGAEILKQNGGGQIVGISSVAGFRGLASVPTYSASKAALSTYMEGIRSHMAQHQILVTVLNPGFIDTPINTHRRVRPFLIDAEDGAKQMLKLIDDQVWSSTIPRWPWALITGFMRYLPERIWGMIKF